VADDVKVSSTAPATVAAAKNDEHDEVGPHATVAQPVACARGFMAYQTRIKSNPSPGKVTVLHSINETWNVKRIMPLKFHKGCAMFDYWPSIIDGVSFVNSLVMVIPQDAFPKLARIVGSRRHLPLIVCVIVLAIMYIKGNKQCCVIFGCSSTVCCFLAPSVCVDHLLLPSIEEVHAYEAHEFLLFCTLNSCARRHATIRNV
jgi:hypothetical protein